MKIRDVVNILKIEVAFKRTPDGRPINDNAVASIQASLDDEKNMDMDVMQCLNCCIIISSLLVSEGCPNCGGHDLDLNIKQ